MSIPFSINSKIENGMYKEDVVTIVGREPDYENSQPDVCWSGGCDEIIQSGSSKYLIWSFGIDTLLIVGLDKNYKVIYHRIGDS